MPEYESVAVPFVQIGNRRGLFRSQIEDNPWIADFVERFRNCFEHDDYLQAYLFIEPEMPTEELPNVP